MTGALPLIIQGGMGVGVSNWRLAQAVSRCGQLGVVSGTALDALLVRRLQTGDPGGHMQRALARLPFPRLARRILDRYLIAGGKPAHRPYVTLPRHDVGGPDELVELCIAGNFVEVTLAREGHDAPVGINYLEKIQMPHLPSLFGAMLAGVDYVLMGAGIPLRIPGAITQLAALEPASYPLAVTERRDPLADADIRVGGVTLHFDPREHLETELAPLKRPAFIPIVSSHVLAATLLKRANGPIDGFVVEGPTAGGHNAPPRGRPQITETGEPLYGDRDVVDLARIKDFGLPFWLAGGYGRSGGLRAARDAGAHGIQAGTAFAFCEESGLADTYKRGLRARAAAGTAHVFTDPLASPTSFPLKVAELDGSLSSARVCESRARVCDLGYLREAYRTESGALGFRCPAEPVAAYVSKGGRIEDTAGRKCICNALVAAVGFPQTRGARVEPALITSGNALQQLVDFMPPGGGSFTAAEVVAHLLRGDGSSVADGAATPAG